MGLQHARLTVLVSGNGTNLQALIGTTFSVRVQYSDPDSHYLDACTSGKLPASIIRVICNRKAAKALERAHHAQIPTTYHNLLPYTRQHPGELARSLYDTKLADLVLEDKPDLVVCAGWMHVFTPSFLTPVTQHALVPVINLHPALPGQFSGIDAIKRAHEQWLDGKIDKSGLMIHHVIPDVDMGSPILVKEIEFVKGEDEDIDFYEQKVHAIEWQAIVEGTLVAINAIKLKT